MTPSDIGADRGRSRARERGVTFEGTAPGPLNAITDVDGVAVGHATLITGSGPLRVGEGPIRTGVTVVLPRRSAPADPVFAGWFALNGNGEMTGAAWVAESGFAEGPIAITNTHSVGVVRDAIIGWQASRGALRQPWSLPIVAETYDGWLNDINGFHVKPEHVAAALDGARDDAVAEGNVGGGTGMICYGFKGGIGTASRRLPDDDGGYTVGVLVQANFGRRDQVRIDGVPVGRVLARESNPSASDETPSAHATGLERADRDLGSIVAVVATDAPLLPHQLERLARRVSLGVARTGGTSANSSGDLFIAFSTANAGAASATPAAEVHMLSNDGITPLFDATVYATEEAIINALFAAETMIGRDDHRIDALPIDRIIGILERHSRS
ncbi:MAG: P1 family peptidase [Longimicrobiales bacterium]